MSSNLLHKNKSASSHRRLIISHHRLTQTDEDISVCVHVSVNKIPHEQQGGF